MGSLKTFRIKDLWVTIISKASENDGQPVVLWLVLYLPFFSFLRTTFGPLTTGFRKAKELTREPGFGPIGPLTAGFENCGPTLVLKTSVQKKKAKAKAKPGFENRFFEHF